MSRNASVRRPFLHVRARHAAAAALWAGLSLASSEASAQLQTALAPGNGDGMNTRLFHAAIDSKGFFTVNGTEVIGKGDVSFGLVLDGGFGLLRVRDPSSTGVSRDPNHIINSQFHGVLFGNYSPIDNLTIGLGIPTELVSGDAQAQNSDVPGIQSSKTELNSFFSGNWQIDAKYRLLRVDSDPIGLAIIAVAEVPISNDAKRGFSSDPGFTFTPTLALEKRLGAEQRFRIGLNGGLRIVTGDGSTIGDLKASSLSLTQQGKVLQHGSTGEFGFAMSYRIWDDVDLVGETYGSYLLKNDAGGSAGLSAEAVGGLKIFVEKNSYLFFGGGGGYLMGYQAANERAFLGFIFEPSIGDRDGDGIPDDIDKCPDEPEDKDGFQDEDGCPDPDNDQDGIPDRLDQCPNEPETKNGVADDDGCPDGVDGDRDHDGIKDSKDKCPDDPEDKDGFQDEDGCPDPDNDKDGILDKVDQCPNEPEDKDGFEDEDGCPDPDNDKDGILDKMDKCPGTDVDVRAGKDTTETYNGFEDEDGCPDKGRVIIEGSTIVILDKVQFDYDSVKIKAESMPIIEAVSSTLKGHPEFTLVQVEGHADERGDDQHNLMLTQGRVDSVVRALTERGVDRSRLRAKGFGEYCPLDSGHAEKAWEKNRRVEFKIVKTKDGPTGVELGCSAATARGVKSDSVP